MYAASVNGQHLHFDVECVWRRNMVMRDRETGTLWQHATGEALIGPLKDAHAQLTLLGGELTTWAAWQQANPNTSAGLAPEHWAGILPKRFVSTLLDKATTHGHMPGLTQNDTRLDAHTPVIGLSIGNAHCAYPLATLQRLGSLDTTLAGKHVQLRYHPASDSVTATTDGQPLLAQRTWWVGWYEFHPDTGVYVECIMPTSS